MHSLGVSISTPSQNQKYTEGLERKYSSPLINHHNQIRFPIPRGIIHPGLFLCLFTPKSTSVSLLHEQAIHRTTSRWRAQKYVSAFNDTMIKIWKEQITLLGVIDTGRLLRSPMAIGLSVDGKFSQVKLSQAFLEYGLWQDYGTGREVPRGNSGDLGRIKKRQRRRWFSRKYYTSVRDNRVSYTI